MRDLLIPHVEHLSKPRPTEMIRAGWIAALGFGIYGFTVGYWRSPLMGGYVALKMPLLIALTLSCNGLINGLLGLLLGSGLGFKQSLHALLSGFAITGIILASLAPITFFIALNLPTHQSMQAVMSHSAYLLMHVSLVGVAGFIGVIRLAKLLESYCPSSSIARATLLAWITGNAFLGCQFSWVLRPFFGSPQLEVAFLRENPMQGNFYEAVWRSLSRLLVGSSSETVISIILAISLCLFLFTQIKKQNQDLKL